MAAASSRVPSSTVMSPEMIAGKYSDSSFSQAAVFNETGYSTAYSSAASMNTCRSNSGTDSTNASWLPAYAGLAVPASAWMIAARSPPRKARKAAAASGWSVLADPALPIPWKVGHLDVLHRRGFRVGRNSPVPVPGHRSFLAGEQVVVVSVRSGLHRG